MALRLSRLRSLFGTKTTGGAAAGAEDRDGPGMELLLAVLLGLAATATAFAAYKAELANGESVLAFNEGIVSITAAVASYNEATQGSLADQQVFLEIAKAQQAGNDDLVDFLTGQIARPEVLPAIEEALDPETEALSPLQAESYVPPEAINQAVADIEAQERSFATAKDEDEEGDRYVLITVILATALFLYGVAAVASTPIVRFGGLIAGAGIFIVSMVLLVSV